MLIAERLEIPMENLKGMAILNGREVAPDLKVIQENTEW
jgi:hypothetical protein